MAEIITMPKLGFDMAEGILVRWLKSEADVIQKGQVLAEIETDKATVEVEAQITGTLHKQLVVEGTAVPIGTPIAIVGEADEAIDVETILSQHEAEIGAELPEPVTTTQAEAPEPVVPIMEGEAKLPSGVKASPVARRLAKEQGIDLTRLTGSGPGGRIVKDDIEAAIETRAPVTAEREKPLLVDALPEETIRTPVSKLRSAIGRRMTAAKQQVPHFYLTIDLNVQPLMVLRKEINNRLPEGEKLSINDFIVKAAALSLRQFPSLNASLEGDHVIRYSEINIGIAVAVDDGLLTVVVRGVDQKPLRTIAKESKRAIERARQGRVRPEDVEGSTFTVSNLGMFDIEEFIAIINPPEAAILAVGSVRDVPIIREGKIVAGRQMKVTLSADHRVTDGAEAARWLQIFKEILEDPLLLLMEP